MLFILMCSSFDDNVKFGTPILGTTTARDVHGFPLRTDADAQVSVGEFKATAAGSKIDLDTRSYGTIGVIVPATEPRRWFSDSDL